MLKKKMHFILLFTSVFALLVFLSGCVEEVSVDEPQRSTSSVRFIQADPAAGSTVYSVYGRFADTNTVVASATVGYTSASSYLTIPSGERKVRIQTSGTVKKDTTIKITFSAYMQNSVFLWSASPKPVYSSIYERLTYSDEAYKIDNGKGTKGAIRFYNALSDVASAKVTLDSLNGTELFTEVTTNSVAGYTNVASKTHTLVISDGTSEIGRVSVPVTGNVRYSVVAFGTSSAATYKVFTDDK